MFISLYYIFGNLFRYILQFVNVSLVYSRLLFILYMAFNFNNYIFHLYILPQKDIFNGILCGFFLSSMIFTILISYFLLSEVLGGLFLLFLLSLPHDYFFMNYGIFIFKLICSGASAWKTFCDLV